MATGLDTQQKIFASKPDDRRAFEALEEHYFLEGDWDELVAIYRARIEAPSVQADESLRVPLLLRLGQILEERVLDLEAASEVYWTLARIDPSNRPALRQLRGIHQRRAQWDMVLQIAELESATEMPPYERAAFEAELGRTWKEHLGDPEEARNAFERALATDADFPAALEGLAQLHQEAGRLEDAAQILERLTTRLRGPERAPFWIALGRLYAGPLDKRERARACFAAALEDDPFQAPAVEWSLLLATVDEDWPVVSELLESRFDLASGARHRAAIAVEASQIQLNHLGSPARARAWVDRALDLSAEEPAVLLAASDVERSDGDQDALLHVLDSLIAITGEKAPRAVLIEAAELHAEFGQTDQALVALRRAANRARDGDERILRLQAQLLRETDAKEELADVLETLTALEGEGDSGERAALLRELAQLQEQDLGEEQLARDNWRRAFDLEPANAQALDALERLHRKQEDWTALQSVLETAIDAAGDDLDAALPTRLAELLLDHAGDPARAHDLFMRALSIDRRCRPALVGLRRLANESGDPDLLLDVCEREAEDCRDGHQMADLARAAIPILLDRGEVEEALEWAKRWSDRAPEAREAFEQRADLEARLGHAEAEIDSRRVLARLQTGRERSTTLARLATLTLGLGRDHDACAAFEQALEAAPESVEILQPLCDLYRRLERPQELVRVLRQLADLLPADEQAETLEELAETLQDPLGELDAAIVVRWRLVELEDGPAEAPRKLEGLLEMAGRYSELAQLCFTQRQLVGDESPEAFELDLRRAKILLDSLGHCDEAAEIFETLAERHPESGEITELLERALRSGDDASGLCRLLERKAEKASDDAQRAEIDFERAALMEEVLGEQRAACDLFESILGLVPESERAHEAELRLERLLEATSQWERLRQHWLARAESLPADEQATLRERIATLCRDRLHDVPGCAAQLERVAELSNDRVHVWQQLEEIYARDLDRPADWLRVVKAELDCDPTPDREFMLRVGAARLCLDEARRPEGREAGEAYEHFERVLELDPGHAEAAEVLALHFAREGRHAESASILEARLDRLAEDSGPETTDLLLRLGQLHADPLADDERARHFFERAHELLGPVSEVAVPLAEVYERTAAHEPLGQLARAFLDASPQQPGSLVWRMRIGASALALGRLEEAAVAYRAALVESPDDREIEDALIEIYEREGEIDPLVELLEKRLPFAREDETIALRLRLAGLHAEGRDEPEEALQHLEWILDSHPQHRDAFDRALGLAEQVADPQRTLSLLDRALAAPLTTSERVEMLERRADLLAGELASPEQAVVNLREVVALDKQRDSARHALRTQLERLGRWPAVLDCLFVDAMNAGDERRCEIFEEAAELAWTRVGPDASLPWLARLQAERPDDPELFARVAEVHRRAGRFEAALRALDEELARRDDAAERCELFLQRARLLERELHAPSRAIQAYREALSLSSEPSEILCELDRLYDLMGRPAERADILEARIEHVDGDARFELRRDVATLFCVDLANPERAIPHLAANVEASRRDPRDEMAALGALDAALRACGRHDAWVGVAERELELIEANQSLEQTTPPEFKRYLHEELSRTYEDLMGDSDRALEHLRALCREGDHAHTPTGQKLRDLLRRTGRLSELAHELTSYLEGLGTDPAAWLELARLREEVLIDLPAAREAYAQAEADPEKRLEALRGQRRCSERLKDWSALASVLEAEYGLADRLQRSERAALARQLGAVSWSHLSDPQAAARGYELALDADARDLAALRALIDVKEATSDTASATLLYRRELETLGSDPDSRARRREVWRRLATICRETEGAEQDAIEAFREAGRLERLEAADELQLARLLDEQDDPEAFFETFGSWCDREDSPATVSDHLELARRLAAEHHSSRALARSERATAVAPESADAWKHLAELQRDAQQPEKSATAFERAAEHAASDEAASLLVSAAGCLEDRDVDRSYALLTRAAELDTACLAAQVALTRIADQLALFEETERAAERAIALATSGARNEALDEAARMEVALLGGRAARRLEHRDVSRRLFEIVLEIDPDRIEALEGVGLAHFEDGDFIAAREPLERRIELDADDPDRALHLAIVARGLEAEEHLDGAWSRYEEAIEADRTLEDAHEGLVRVHERAARPAEALEALVRWSETSRDAGTRAMAAYRAAEHALALEDEDQALIQLERATDADPQLAPAWLMRCEVAAERSPDAEVLGLCRRALDVIEPGPMSSQISMRAARLEEIAGHTEKARALYAETRRWDPRATEAALCESRLARMAGDWVDADEILSDFMGTHPDPESPTLAHVHLERARLLSGPLEKPEQAVTSYEAALALQPELGVARTALASLLVHSPARWREALALHREILEASPTTANSLRAIGQLADTRGAADVAGGARSVLRALGLASPQEESDAPATFQFPIHPGPPMSHQDGERLRRIAHQVREELATVLGPQDADRRLESEDPELARALRQIEEIEDELSAPGLARLDADERGKLFATLAALLLDPGGNGEESRYRDALDEAVGRWTRRKIRRMVEETTLADIEAFDHESWGFELRAIAAAQVVDRNGGDLRCVLRALVLLEKERSDEPLPEGARIATLVADSEPARRLLKRISSLLCDRLERSH